MAPPTDADRDAAAEPLRNELVNFLVEQHYLESPRVEEALRAVPRHRFVPEVDLQRAHANVAILTSTDDDGFALSSVSQPAIVALQLEQAIPASGARILEIGAGRCYNAALLAHLVGAHGRVVTIDIDPELVAAGKETLSQLGYNNVHVKCADGAEGAPEEAPFALIAVTTGAADLPPAWAEQLDVGGRIVVPLSIRGLSRSIAFRQEDDHLVSESVEPCGFISMRGSSSAEDDIVEIAKGATLHVGEAQPVNQRALRASIGSGCSILWSGVTIGYEEGVLPDLEMWIATACQRYGRIEVNPTIASRRTFGWVTYHGASVTWSSDSLAYVVLRETDDGSHVELGVYAFGPGRDELAGQLVRHLQSWDRDVRDFQLPLVYAYAADTPTHSLAPGRVVDKPLSRLVMAFD